MNHTMTGSELMCYKRVPVVSLLWQVMNEEGRVPVVSLLWQVMNEEGRVPVVSLLWQVMNEEETGL